MQKQVIGGWRAAKFLRAECQAGGHRTWRGTGLIRLLPAVPSSNLPRLINASALAGARRESCQIRLGEGEGLGHRKRRSPDLFTPTSRTAGRHMLSANVCALSFSKQVNSTDLGMQIKTPPRARGRFGRPSRIQRAVAGPGKAPSGASAAHGMHSLGRAHKTAAGRRGRGRTDR